MEEPWLFSVLFPSVLPFPSPPSSSSLSNIDLGSENPVGEIDFAVFKKQNGGARSLLRSIKDYSGLDFCRYRIFGDPALNGSIPVGDEFFIAEEDADFALGALRTV